MRNRTYGGVRGRKTKVGRKLLRFPPTRFYTSKGLLSENKWPVAHATRGGDGRQEGRESSY